MTHAWTDSRSRSTLAINCFFVLLTLLPARLFAQTVPAPWAVSDIGVPTIAGSATYNAGAFNVTAAGSGIGAQQDQFSIVQQRLTGDATIIARVRAPQNGDSAAMAGVMIRESLAAASRNVFAMVTGGSRSVSFQRRRVTGGDSIRTNSGTAVTVWLKIERRSSTFTAFRSSDGVTWSEIGTEIIAMPSTVYVGLALTSHQTLTATTVAFTNVSAVATSALPPPPTPPQGWSGTDIGLPATAGSESQSAGVYTVSGGGSGMSGSADQFHFMYRQVTGDVDIVGRVKAVQYINATTNGGLMVRDSLTPNAAYGSIAMSAGGGATFQRRAAAGGLSTATVNGTMNTPYWVKLQVRAGVVTAFQSATGSSWLQVGTVTLPLPSSFYVGVEVTSTDAATKASAIFDSLAVTTSQNQPPTVSLTAPDPTASYTAPAQVTISADALDTDGTIASVDFYANGVLLGSVSSAPYSYTWSNVAAGSYSFAAVAHDNGGASTTSDTRSISVNPAANQSPTVSLTAPASGATYNAPATITVAASATDADGSITKVDFYANGLLLGSASAAPYSYTWSNVAAGSYSLTAVAQDNRGAATTSATRSVTVTGTALPAGWSSADIGSPTAAGSTQYSGGTFTVKGAGILWNYSDQFRLVYQQFTGDITITSRVVSIENTSPWAKAGVMIRETLSADSKNTSLVLTPGNGAIFFYRDTTGQPPQGPFSVGAGAPAWVRLERRGTVVTAFYSSDGVAWTAIGTAPMTTSTMYVGLAVSSEDSTRTAAGVFDNVTVSTPTNQAPSVSLTAPANGATYTAPATVTLSATATDSDGTVSRVDFYSGSTLVGSATASPYTATWTNVAAGTYSLTAVARDNAGAATTSSVRTITVNAPANQAPTVSLTAPANGATYTAPATVTLSATASDTDGTVSRVDFYNGSTLVGSATASPYTATWTNVAAGSYSLTAVARDNAGAATTSSVRTITVNPPANQAPMVSLTAPANGATYTAPATVTLSATASDTDGTVSRVDFYNGSTLIGSATASPYNFSWTNVATGTYSLTAVARDNAGATTTSAARSITVTGSTALPAGWTSADIGSPTAAGSAQYSSGTFTVKGAGILWNYSDQFRFAYQQFTGDITITSRVVSIENTSPWAKAGVMIRETLSADSSNTSLVATPGNGEIFFHRDTTAQPPQGPFTASTAAPAWVRLDRRGTVVTAFYSSDGVSWTSVGTSTMATPTMYVGLAVSSEDSTRTAAGVFDSVTVTTPTPNQAPTASLTAPANGATYTAPASMTLSATASDSDGTIARVDFYAGTALVGSATSSPYNFTWSNVAAGTYSLTAVARDNVGAATTSAARSITVNPSANQAPTVSLTAPANGATYTAPATVTLSATASDTDGTISSVSFYAGSTLVGTDTTSPYSVTWSNVAAGTYSLTAVASDNGGATKTSTAISVTVSATTGSNRHAVFTASPDHATLVVSYRLEIFSAGANPNTATPIASQNLGKPAVVNGDCDVDITQTVNALASGSYIATVSAVGNSGSSRGGAVSFTK